MNILFLDAVGGPKSDLYSFFALILISPFIFAFLIVVFFNLLDRISKKSNPGADK